MTNAFEYVENLSRTLPVRFKARMTRKRMYSGRLFSAIVKPNSPKLEASVTCFFFFHFVIIYVYAHACVGLRFRSAKIWIKRNNRKKALLKQGKPRK